MSGPPWIYRGELVHVVDGDTVDLRVSRPDDFGFRMWSERSAVMRFRLSGIDTPERTGTTRVMGLAAAAFLQDLLKDARHIEVESLGEADKYGGRWDARIRLLGDAPDVWVDVGQYLVLLGYARAYHGKGPRPTWNPALPYPLVQP